MFFTPVCDSVHREGGLPDTLPLQTLLGNPSRADTPWPDTPSPWSNTPPPGQTPPPLGRHPPPERRPLQRMVRIILGCILVSVADQYGHILNAPPALTQFSSFSCSFWEMLAE